ncbi:MAG: DUF2067 family protein [Infirmifilum sp.]
MRGRTLTLVFSSAEEALNFLKKLERFLPGKSFLGELKVNKVKIFIPESDNAEQVLGKIRELYNQQKQLHTYNAPRDYDIPTLFSLSKLEVPIPLAVVVDSLRVQGFKAEVFGEKLRTNAPLNVITKNIESISIIYRELLEFKMTAQARRLIALFSHVNNIPSEDAIKQLSTLGLIVDRGGVISLKVNYEVAVKTLFS